MFAWYSGWTAWQRWKMYQAVHPYQPTTPFVRPSKLFERNQQNRERDSLSPPSKPKSSRMMQDFDFLWLFHRERRYGTIKDRYLSKTLRSYDGTIPGFERCPICSPAAVERPRWYPSGSSSLTLCFWWKTSNSAEGTCKFSLWCSGYKSQ